MLVNYYCSFPEQFQAECLDSIHSIQYTLETAWICLNPVPISTWCISLRSLSFVGGGAVACLMTKHKPLLYYWNLKDLSASRWVRREESFCRSEKECLAVFAARHRHIVELFARRRFGSWWRIARIPTLALGGRTLLMEMLLVPGTFAWSKINTPMMQDGALDFDEFAGGWAKMA